MGFFWYCVYNGIALPLLRAVVLVGRLLNTKIRAGLEGRKSLYDELGRKMPALEGRSPSFWIHNSSMGEYEQARPLIKRLKEQYQNCRIFVSFFSPSAFDHIRHDEGADHLCYIPFDTRKQARRFISMISPDIVVVVRHDIWPNHLYVLYDRSIPAVLINCTFGQTMSVWKRLSLGFNRFLHRPFRLILTVSHQAAAYCRATHLGSGRAEMVGDTRYDQVVRRAKEAETIIAPLRRLKGKRFGFVMGSTWPTDEAVLFQAVDQLMTEGKQLWMVIVPHEPTPEHLSQIESKLKDMDFPVVRFSDAIKGKGDTGDVLLVDRVGVLASMYALGELCYVGGGFGPGIHNVLEPAALGKAVIFGPRHRNSYEAGQLIRRGVGFECQDEEQMVEILSALITDSSRRSALGRRAEQLVNENLGATDRIIEHLDRLLNGL